MKLVFLVEEASMRDTLNGLLPRVLPTDVAWQCIPHEGKSDLEKSIPRKLRAWNEPGVRFVVLRDQDSGDCREVKRRLVELCRQGGKPDALVRVVCRELESVSSQQPRDSRLSEWYSEGNEGRQRKRV